MPDYVARSSDFFVAGQGHLCRAVLEGVAMSLRECRDALFDAGLAFSGAVLTGGGLRSPLWQRIVVDVLGQSARSVAMQGPGIGAAQLAAEAIGLGGPVRDVAAEARAAV